MRNTNIRVRLGWSAVCIPFVVAACQAPASTLKQATAFTDKNWQMKELTVSPEVDWNGDGIPDTDIFQLLDVCDQDDGFRFRSDNSVIRLHGEERCDEEEEAEEEVGTWTYGDNDHKLTFIEDVDDIQEFKVLESSANRLILLYRFQSTDEQWHDMTAVYTLRP